MARQLPDITQVLRAPANISAAIETTLPANFPRVSSVITQATSALPAPPTIPANIAGRALPQLPAIRNVQSQIAGVLGGVPKLPAAPGTGVQVGATPKEPTTGVFRVGV